MDEVIRELIHQLPPDAQDLLRRLLDGEWDPRDMFPIIIAIWEISGRNSRLLLRLIAELVRTGQLPPRLLERLWSMLNLPTAEAAAGGAEGAAAGGAAAEGAAAGGAAAEGTAAGGAAAGGTTAGGTAAGGTAAGTTAAEGGGAVAGGIGAGAVISVAVAVAAVALAAYLIGREANRAIVNLPAGTPCGGTGAAALATATTVRSVSVNAFGGRNSYNEAIIAAQSVCAGSAGACKGSCGAGTSCAPNVSVQTVDQTFKFFYTTTDLTFTCPCECL